MLANVWNGCCPTIPAGMKWLFLALLLIETDTRFYLKTKNSNFFNYLRNIYLLFYSDLIAKLG